MRGFEHSIPVANAKSHVRALPARPNSLRSGRGTVHRHWLLIDRFFSQNVEKGFHVSWVHPECTDCHSVTGRRPHVRSEPYCDRQGFADVIAGRVDDLQHMNQPG
jgi:hypothetical protein